MKKFVLILCTLYMVPLYLVSQVYLPLEIEEGMTQEMTSGVRVPVHGCRQPISIPAAVGNGFRTDGYSSYVEMPIKGLIRNNALGVNMKDSVVSTLTISFWCAIETYPMMTTGTMSPAHQLYTDILGNIDDKKHTGFAFQLSNQGRFRFRCYSSGWEVTCDGGDAKLWWNQWHHLVATIDGYNQEIHFYDNGVEVAGTGCMYDATVGEKNLFIGRSINDTVMDGMFNLNYFNGIIDEVRIDTGIWAMRDIAVSAPEHEVDFNVPMEAYAEDLCRPRYHGMPSQGWTNESHGMAYSDGKYHVFFQKNGNGPYMSRLHWGHISSPDLCHWHEDVVALMPDQDYDIKGCWSGCIVRDDEITHGEPWALYSAIGNRESFNAENPDDGSHCELMFASPKDAALKYWHKQAQPGICCPFREDFRDPYFFRANGRAYIIAGCSNNGLGIATLHRYEGDNRWSSDGDIFFSEGPLADAGNFWEMPNVTPFGDNRWVFTCTPMSTSYGVRCLYWIGGIDGGGHFYAWQGPQTIELPGMAKDGFGLLSPTILQRNGKTIVLGIVPDKASTTLNYTAGYAHLYSFPREWRLDGEGNLCQSPFEGLFALRTPERVVKSSLDIREDTVMDLAPVEGRSVELCTTFETGEAQVGFTLLKNSYGGMKVYIDPEEQKLVVDMTSIGRRANDIGVFDGLYSSVIPSGLPKGGTCKLDVFFDHSILDIFVNDRYATSIRVFPYDYSANGCEFYVEGGEAKIHSLQAYGLGEITHYSKAQGVEAPQAEEPFVIKGQQVCYETSYPSVIRVYDNMGRLLQAQQVQGNGTMTVTHKGYVLVNLENAVQHFTKSVMIL